MGAAAVLHADSRLAPPAARASAPRPPRQRRVDRRAPVIPDGLGPRRKHHHGGVGLEQAAPSRRATARNPRPRTRDPSAAAIARERLHRPGPEHTRHVEQKAALLVAKRLASRHVGAEVVHFPVRGDREMQRVQTAVDEHHPVLSRHSVRDRAHRDTGSRGAHPRRARPRRPSMRRGSPRKRSAVPCGSPGFAAAPDTRAARDPEREIRSIRGTMTPGMPARRRAFSARPVGRTRAGRLMTGAVLRDRSSSARSSALPAQIGIADGVHHPLVRRQLGGRVGIVRVERMDGESPIVDPQPRSGCCRRARTPAAGWARRSPAPR